MSDSPAVSWQDRGETSCRQRNRLAGRKALVIGADSNIGRVVAIACAREGADLALHYLSAHDGPAQALLAQLQDQGVRAVGIPGDLRDQAFCIAMVERARDALGGIDMLANAGCVPPRDEEAQLDDIPFRDHLYAMFWLCRNALPVMAPGASIINTDWRQSCRRDGLLQRADASTQAATVAFTRALVRQGEARGIRVNLVRPAPTWSPTRLDGDQLAQIAAVYVRLASRDSNLASGEIYRMTGELTGEVMSEVMEKITGKSWE